MRRAHSLALALGLSLAFVGCGGDDEQNPTIDARLADAAAIDGATVDAAPNDGRVDDAAVDATPDAPAATGVTEVSCTGATIASEVTASTGMFTITDTTIAVNDIVRFTMPASHSAVSGTVPGTPDGKFTVALNTTKCLRFTIAGTYPFYCNPHLFTGSLTVGP